MHPLAHSLGKAEKDLLRETADSRMAQLGEDALVGLHKRIRRARNKYVGIHRRAGSAAVGKKGGRGLAAKKNRRNAERAEVFEDALARVSAQLAVAAAAEAESLKAARLAAANPPGTWPGSTQEAPPTPAPVAAATGVPASDPVADRRPKGPGRTKRNASVKALGKRHQARRDRRA